MNWDNQGSPALHDEPGAPVRITSDMLADEPAPRPRPITSDMLAEVAPSPPADPRIDFEKGMSRFPKLTLFLIAANVCVFILELAGGALESRDSIIRAGALSREHILRGEFWRIASAAFLHGGFEHLFGNCGILLILGMACEHAFGWLRMLAIYALSGLLGAGFSMLMNPGPSVGASGAIFGVAAAVIVFLYRNQSRFFMRDKRIGFVLLVWAGISAFMGFLSPLIDNFNHIGGFAGGALGALLFQPRSHS